MICVQQLINSCSNISDVDNRWGTYSLVCNSWSTASVICVTWITGGIRLIPFIYEWFFKSMTLYELWLFFSGFPFDSRVRRSSVLTSNQSGHRWYRQILFEPDASLSKNVYIFYCIFTVYFTVYQAHFTIYNTVYTILCEALNWIYKYHT